MRQSELFRYIELIIALIIAAQCIVPFYINPKIGSISIHIRNISLYVGIILILYNLIFTKARLRLPSFPSSAVLLCLAVSWILIVSSAIGRSFGPLYSFSSLLINEFLPDAVFFSLFYLMSENKGFINRISDFMIPIVIGVLSIELVEVYNQKNPLLQYGSSFDERFIPNLLRNNKYRAFSTFPHPLVLGEFLSFGCCFCLYSMTNGKKSKKLFAAITIIAALIGAYYTNTRSMVFSCAIAIFSYFIFRYLSNYTYRFGRSKAKFLYGVISIFFVCFAVLAWPILTPIFAGKTSDEIKSTVARAYMHSEGLPHIFDAFNGYGYGMSLKIAGLVTEHSLGLDDYFLFVALNSGFIAAFFLLITAFYLINLSSSKPNIFNNDFDKSALIGSVSTIWLFNCFVQSVPSVHFFYYAALGYALGKTQFKEDVFFDYRAESKRLNEKKLGDIRRV